jgi:hypothetical protein
MKEQAYLVFLHLCEVIGADEESSIIRCKEMWHVLRDDQQVRQNDPFYLFGDSEET